jgi:hypothetical protein
MARPILLALLLAGVVLPAQAQTGGGTSGQGANTAPSLRYGSELLLGRSHAQGGGAAGGGAGNDRERVVLRRHGAETMPAIQAGQIGQAARLQVQEPRRPLDNRLLSGGSGRGSSGDAGRQGGRGAIIPFGAERNVEGGGQSAGGQGGERPRFAAFPPRDPSTAPGAIRGQAQQPDQARSPAPRQAQSAPPTQPRPPAIQAQPATPSAQTQAAPRPRSQPTPSAIRQAPAGNTSQSILPGGNRFSNIAHQGLPTPPTLSDETRAALDRLSPRQQEAYRASVRDIARSNPGRTLSEPEVRLLLEAAQSRS